MLDELEENGCELNLLLLRGRTAHSSQHQESSREVMLGQRTGGRVGCSNGQSKESQVPLVTPKGG